MLFGTLFHPSVFNKDSGVVASSTTTTQDGVAILKELSEPSASAVGNKKKVWTPFKDILIHRELFEKGILAIVPKQMQSILAQVEFSENSYSIGDRRFHFHLPAESANTEKNNNTTARPRLDKYTVKRNKKLYKELTGSTSDTVLVANSRHRDEVFIPLNLNADSAIYVYPWLSHASNASLPGFTKCVTAGCLIGANLLGYFENDELGTRFSLIKHNIKFYNDTQRIGGVIFNADDVNPYEEILFAEFEKLIRFFDLYSQSDKPKEIIYHLPYYDYILFGIQLFIQGRMTLNALGNLIYIILERRETYITRLNLLIGSTPNITLTIESPFENLFGPVAKILEPIEARFALTGDEDDQEEQQKIYNKMNAIAEKFLQIVEVAPKEIFASIGEDEQRMAERKLVQCCLEKLQKNQFNQKHSEVWEDFGNIRAEDLPCREDGFLRREKAPADIDNIEELFKAANAFLIAVASRGAQDGEVCSYLPLTEKPIQVIYANYLAAMKVAQASRHFLSSFASIDVSEDRAESSDTLLIPTENNQCLKSYLPYSNVFNATVLDSVAAYSYHTKGNLFYLGDCLNTLSDLFDNGILDELARNAKLFANRESPFTLSKLLERIAPQLPKSTASGRARSLSVSLSFRKSDSLSSLNSLREAEVSSEDTEKSSSDSSPGTSPPKSNPTRLLN